jgi:hypothetical protein
MWLILPLHLLHHGAFSDTTHLQRSGRTATPRNYELIAKVGLLTASSTLFCIILLLFQNVPLDD